VALQAGVRWGWMNPGTAVSSLESSAMARGQARTTQLGGAVPRAFQRCWVPRGTPLMLYPDTSSPIIIIIIISSSSSSSSAGPHSRSWRLGKPQQLVMQAAQALVQGRGLPYWTRCWTARARGALGAVLAALRVARQLLVAVGAGRPGPGLARRVRRCNCVATAMTAAAVRA
jgi:hypothetical protein